MSSRRTVPQTYTTAPPLYVPVSPCVQGDALSGRASVFTVGDRWGLVTYALGIALVNAPPNTDGGTRMMV